MFPRVLISGECSDDLRATLVGRGYLPVHDLGGADVVLVTPGIGPADLSLAVSGRGVGVVALGPAAPESVAAAGIHPAPAPTGRVVAATHPAATSLDLLARVSPP